MLTEDERRQAADTILRAERERNAITQLSRTKRFLDLGAQTLLIPYVQSAEEARHAVAVMRYPPEGVRGVSAVTHATKFGRVEGYAKRAAGELCLLVQVETQEALDALETISAVDGVDGVFIGPGDLAASLGHAGHTLHPTSSSPSPSKTQSAASVPAASPPAS